LPLGTTTICGVIDGGDWLTATHESSTDTSAVESRVLIGLNNIRSPGLSCL
jgi:hypothetical protein